MLLSKARTKAFIGDKEKPLVLLVDIFLCIIAKKGVMWYDQKVKEKIFEKDIIEQKLKIRKMTYLLKQMIYNPKSKNSISTISIVKKYLKDQNLYKIILIILIKIRKKKKTILSIYDRIVFLITYV